MKSTQSNYTILLTLLSGLLWGLSVNHLFGISIAFVFPFYLVGIFLTLEKQTNWKGWLLHGYVFSFVALALALLGFIWVEPLAGLIMVICIALTYTIPFVLLYAIRRKLKTESGFSFLILALLWPPLEWFVNELVLGIPITLFDIGPANYPVFIQFVDITGFTGISTWVIVFGSMSWLIKSDTNPLNPSNAIMWNGLGFRRGEI